MTDSAWSRADSIAERGIDDRDSTRLPSTNSDSDRNRAVLSTSNAPGSSPFSTAAPSRWA